MASETSSIKIDYSRYVIVRTKSGSETHFGRPNTSIVAGHQLPSARSITFKANGATEVTCERCRPIWEEASRS